MTRTTHELPVLRDDALYMSDNGAILCGRHSGASARYAGRDISGLPVLEITGKMLADLIAEFASFGMGESAIRCEVPSCTCRAKRVVLR